MSEKIVHPEHPLLHMAYYERARKINMVGVNGGGYPLSLISDNFEEKDPFISISYENGKIFYTGLLSAFDIESMGHSLKDAKIVNVSRAGFEKMGLLKLKKVPHYLVETDACPVASDEYDRIYEVAKVVNIGKFVSHSALGIPYEEFSLWLLTSVQEEPFEVEVPEEYYEAIRRSAVFEVPCIVTHKQDKVCKIKILVGL